MADKGKMNEKKSGAGGSDDPKGARGPLGLALVTFVYYHFHGLRVNGFGYIKQFLGSVCLWIVSWLAEDQRAPPRIQQTG